MPSTPLVKIVVRGTMCTKYCGSNELARHLLSSMRQGTNMTGMPWRFTAMKNRVLSAPLPVYVPLFTWAECRSAEINSNFLAEIRGIYSILAQGCQKIRGAKFWEEIRYHELHNCTNSPIEKNFGDLYMFGLPLASSGIQFTKWCMDVNTCPYKQTYQMYRRWSGTTGTIAPWVCSFCSLFKCLIACNLISKVLLRVIR